MRNLGNLVHQHLDPDRQADLRKLIRARSPVPPEILKRILDANAKRIRPGRIAEKLTHDEVYDGMGKGWTATKVAMLIRDAQKDDAKAETH